MSYNLEWKEKYLIVTFQRDFSLEHFLEVNSIVATDNRFNSLIGTIADVREISSFDLTDKDLRLASHVAKIFPALHKKFRRFAYVVEHDFQIKLLTQYIEKYAHVEWERKIFISLKEAEKWVLFNTPNE